MLVNIIQQYLSNYNSPTRYFRSGVGWGEATPRSGWAAFEGYYSANPVAPEQLWQEALRVFKTPLPVVVRMQQSPAVGRRTGAVMKALEGKQAVDGVPRAWEMPVNEEVRSAVASLQSVGGLHR